LTCRKAVSEKINRLFAMPDDKTGKKKTGNRHRKLEKIRYWVTISCVSAFTCRSPPQCGVTVFDCLEGVQPRK
jgi:hypothetical protein